MCLAQGPQRSDAGEARTRGRSVSSNYYWVWKCLVFSSSAFISNAFQTAFIMEANNMNSDQTAPGSYCVQYRLSKNQADIKADITCSVMKSLKSLSLESILRKTIEGYLESVPSLTFKTIKTKLIIHAFHSSIYLQSKWMLYFSHATMV